MPADSQDFALLRETVNGFLRASFDEVRQDRDGDFFVRSLGVTTWVQPRSLAEDQTAVLIWSPSNIGVTVDAEMTSFLAAEANNLAFGQFELHDAGRPPSRWSGPRIHVSHALLGEFLSRDELAVAVQAVADASAHYGPILKERFGGRLAREQEIVAGQPIPLLEEIAEVVERTGQWPPEPGTVSATSTAAHRPSATQGVFALLGIVAGVVGAVFAYGATSSWFVVAFAFLAGSYLIGRAASDIVTDPNKVRRALYFLIPPAAAAPVLLLAYELWGRWWLAVLLALVGWTIGSGIGHLLFPRIAREETVDSAERTRRSLGLGN